MAINNSRIYVGELDFATIKSNFKEYLKGQDTFSDYDFEGSNMSMLLDVLAYNTHYRGLYDSFAINESFLDSASKRENVVSAAKRIGYTPTSIKASVAYVNFSLTNTVAGPATLILPKSSPFIVTIGSTSYVFITTETYSASNVGGSYSFDGMKLTQGSYVTNRFDVQTGAKYILPNSNVDVDTVLVKVQENSQSSIYTTYIKSDGLIGTASTDRVYWVKEIEGGLFELEFGNNVVGKGLTTGNIVHVEYVTTDGAVANGAKLFRYVGPALYSGVVSISIVTQSSGGKDAEDINSIKFNAPRLFSTQNRAVTVEDYRNLVYNLVPEASSVNAWSGADNNPPEYGKVFICIKPKTLEKFTSIEKYNIESNILRTKNVVTVIPVILDPQYLNVALDVNVYFNPNATTKSSNDVKLLVQNAIEAYNISELQKFESVMRFSKLSRLIDDSDPSIVSNVTNVMIRRKIEPKYNSYASYRINLVNPVHLDVAGGSIQSTGFYTVGSTDVHYIDDDGAGNIRLFTIVNSAKQIINPKAGSVDYGLGIVLLNGLYVTSIVGQEWAFVIKPSSYDVVSILDQLVVIPSNFVTVNVISDTSSGANHTFTSSRS